ncbi:beta-galactosidase [Polaribacter sp. KT25b]|uniref:glycoside hydrolase family 42 n=1 Tax=Polaribacter sp. KT25b TaxID=1855336 RepID=UPI00087B6DBA|nr:glycoside hydrolase family 42 [Polaribacter sp. KT25b]SDR69976.1 beta-galactosidase [Polaribacter sp. KT25b]
MKQLIKTILIFVLVLIFFSYAKEKNKYETEALQKIEQLEILMAKAKKNTIDVKREETLLWFSKEFIKFANWDEANKDQVEKSFSYDRFYKKDPVKWAIELPNLERKKVIEMLGKGILQLQKVLDGSIVRRPTPKVDWGGIKVTDRALINKEKPVFLHDYFSKTVGIPLTNKDVYNDHLGNMFHGGENLYEEHQDRAINPWLLNEDGSFDADRLKLLTNIPDTNIGFLYLWNSGLPDWLKTKDSTVQVGRSLFMGLDIDNPLVRNHWGKIANKVGELTNGKKVTQLGFVLANEPHWFAEKEYWTQKFGEMNSISIHTLNKFRKFLSNAYNNDIKALNKNWKSSFEDFNAVEIEIPISKKNQGKPIWYDWCRFGMARSLDWFTYIQKELRVLYPEAPTSIKMQPRYFAGNYRSHGLDFESLTELTSVIGDDAKAQSSRSFGAKNPESWENRYAYSWEEISFSYDFMESVSPNKIHFNSETHFLSLSNWKDLNTPTDYVRNVFWLATLHGMDASTSWFWARDPDGSPENRLEGDLDFWDPGLGGAYAGSANMQPQMVNEIAQVFMDMNSFSEEIMALREQRKSLRVFYSETSAINKKQHMTELFELYESLYFEGIPLGYATEKIIKKQNHNNWDAIVVYKTQFVTDSEFDALQDYLNYGGTIILDNKESLSKNEYGKLRKKKLQKGKGKLIFVKSNSLEGMKKASIESIPKNLSKIKLTESNGTAFKGCTWRVVKNKKGGYWVNILNIGKNDAKLKLSFKDGKKPIITNMLTQEKLKADFDLKSNGVLLLKITE